MMIASATLWISALLLLLLVQTGPARGVAVVGVDLGHLYFKQALVSAGAHARLVAASHC